MSLNKLLLISVFISLSFMATRGIAADSPPRKENKGKETPSESSQTWTYDRLREAVPRSLPEPRKPYDKQHRAVIPHDKQREEKTFEPGKAPTLILPERQSLQEQPLSALSPNRQDAQPHVQSLIRMAAAKSGPPSKSGSSNTVRRGAVPHQAGTENAHFISSRVIPDGARTIYPYKAIGKLFYRDPNTNRDYTCSAAVIKPRLILTAGHCVHAGTGGDKGYFRDFRFIPAYEAGPDPEPFLAWKSSFVITTVEWMASNGEVPNAADVAIIELEDQIINGGIHKIGEVTGTFGTKTKALIPNHTTKLGYPGNLDNGEKLHLVHSQHHRPIQPRNVEYGSDMGAGSSGGPWIENFGIPAIGQTAQFNVIVGITSYGYTSPAPMVQGSSELDEPFLKIREIACKHRPGNCE